MKVYILSDYEEDGAEHVSATLDKEKLPEMLDKLGYGKRPEAKEKLAALLEKDELLTRHGKDLESGWGGSMLHIVELV